MKQEDKDLLLKDLCARLPYGVRVKTDFYPEPIHIGAIEINQFPTDIDLWPMTPLDVNGSNLKLDDVLLYLRPMSSMTEEEMEELEKITYHTFKYEKGDREIWTNSYHKVQLFNGAGELYGAGEPTNMLCSSSICIKLIDWLNAHHFDYRGLIEKGLALEAPEGMYQ